MAYSLTDLQKLMLRVLAEADGQETVGAVAIANRMCSANSPLGPMVSSADVNRIGRQLVGRGLAERFGSQRSHKRFRLTEAGRERNNSAQGFI